MIDARVYIAMLIRFVSLWFSYGTIYRRHVQLSSRKAVHDRWRLAWR